MRKRLLKGISTILGIMALVFSLSACAKNDSKSSEKQASPKFNLVCTVNKVSVHPGDTITYVLLFTNVSNENLTDIVIKDSLPSDLKLTGTIDAAGTFASGMSDLNKLFTSGTKFSSLKVGGHVRITINAIINNPTRYQQENLRNYSTASCKQEAKEKNTTDNGAGTVVTPE